MATLQQTISYIRRHTTKQWRSEKPKFRGWRAKAPKLTGWRRRWRNREWVFFSLANYGGLGSYFEEVILSGILSLRQCFAPSTKTCRAGGPTSTSYTSGLWILEVRVTEMKTGFRVTSYRVNNFGRVMSGHGSVYHSGFGILISNKRLSLWSIAPFQQTNICLLLCSLLSLDSDSLTSRNFHLLMCSLTFLSLVRSGRVTGSETSKLGQVMGQTFPPGIRESIRFNCVVLVWLRHLT